MNTASFLSQADYPGEIAHHRFPPAHCRAWLTGIDGQEPCLKPWVQTTAAGNTSRREMEPQDMKDDQRSPNSLCDQTNLHFPSSSLPWQSGEWFVDGGQATASRRPRSFKALQAHQQKLLVLPSGGLFPAQALSVSGQWVEHEGAICRAKTHQYMTRFSARHAELCAGNLFSAIDIAPW